MSFSTDLAKLVADQLSRFVTLNRHQLAGQAGNLDFWLAQVRHALAVIDGYGTRYDRLRAGQDQYVAAHGTVEFDLGTEFPGEQKASPPRRTPRHEIEKARRELTAAAERFLDRCRREGLVSESAWSTARRDLGLE